MKTFLPVAFLLALLAPTIHAFSVAHRAIVGSSSRSPSLTVLAMVEDTKTSSPAIAKRTDLDKGPAKKMDETIFNFNKILIDSVYDLIW